MINYRGLANMKLATPKMFCAYSVNDILEPMTYIYKKYCKKQKRPCYGVGISMGANILANLIGFESEKCFLNGAFVF